MSKIITDKNDHVIKNYQRWISDLPEFTEEAINPQRRGKVDFSLFSYN